MNKIRNLIDKIKWEPIRHLYYEAETFTLFHPERMKRLIQTHGSSDNLEVRPQAGRIVLVSTEALESVSLTELLEKTSNLLAKAVEVGAGLVVFPPNVADILLQLAPVNTPRVTRLILDAFETFWGSLAIKYRLWIIAGSRTLYSKAHKREVCYCFDPTGRCRYQFKTHLSPDELRDGYLPGRLVKVFETGAGQVAISFPGEEQHFELGRMQAAKGAKIVIRLGAWAGNLEVKNLHGEWARAQENNFYYLSGNQIFLPAYLSIDGSGVMAHAAAKDLPFILVELNLGRLALTTEEPAATPSVNRELMNQYLPNLYRQLERGI